MAKRGLSTQRMTVVPHSVGRRLVVVGALVAFGLVLALAAFWLGRLQAGVDLAALASLRAQGDADAAELASLRSRLVDMELARNVDEQAAGELQGTIKELRDEVGALRKEVTLYKSLMAPGSLDEGLKIADFELVRHGADTDYQYRLLLTQAARRRDWVQGTVTLEIAGRGASQEAEQVLSLTDLGYSGTYPLSYRFRYFQDLDGEVRIPEGFKPVRVIVTTTPKGRGAKPLVRSFDWMVEES